MPTDTGVDMAINVEFETFLVALRGEGIRILILVEDCDVAAGWRILSENDLDKISRSFETGTAANQGVSGRLCYNLEEAASAVGVSVHKFNTWIRRHRDPVPHIKDGRRILIPVMLLTEWLRDEAARHVPE